MAEIHSSDTLKMIRESLCVAQMAIPFVTSIGQYWVHSQRLQRLIDDIDRQGPLGPDGKHDDRHTATCGCEDAPRARRAHTEGDKP